MFRPSDVRRVQQAFDTDIIPPYEAAVTLSEDRLTLTVAIADPDDAALPVAQASWTYDEAFRYRQQPTSDELAQIVAQFIVICSDYTAAKAGS